MSNRINSGTIGLILLFIACILFWCFIWHIGCLHTNQKHRINELEKQIIILQKGVMDESKSE